MAASDATVAFSQIDFDTITITTGAAVAYMMTLQKGTLTWGVETPPKTEMLVRNKHHSTPTLRKTGDGKVTGAIKLYISTFLGSSAFSPYELFVSGAAVSTGAGDGGMFSMSVPVTGDGGAPSQTAVFAYCHFMNVKVDIEDGLYVLSADFEDLENKPTIT